VLCGQIFLPVWEQKLFADGSKKRHRAGQMSVSEIMTIIIYFHRSLYRNFKAHYIEHVCQHLRGKFPNVVSYERFVILTPSVFGPLSAYLKSLYANRSGISFVDSTALEVCDNHRIHNHKVFECIAERGKGSMGWFYGLKVHLVINDRGYISQPLFEQLLETFNLQLITRIKKNMKNRLMPMIDKILLRKRAIIESVMDQLKKPSLGIIPSGLPVLAA
jgi:hypothetical protein